MRPCFKNFLPKIFKIKKFEAKVTSSSGERGSNEGGKGSDSQTGSSTSLVETVRLFENLIYYDQDEVTG